ncbi:SusD family protein [compost metagenome]
MLLLAEAKYHLGKDAEAIALLDQVRERAGLPSYATSMLNTAYRSKYPTLKEAILHERRVELAFENQRWFDLIRNYNAQELVTYFKTKSQADYGNAKISNISTKDRYYPIPFDEYKLDPARMYQNPGY